MNPPCHHWISVTTALPETENCVLVSDPDPRSTDPVWLGFYWRGQWHRESGARVPGRVTHWQPLPAPPH